MRRELILAHGFAETYGTGTLIGLILKDWNGPISSLTELHLVFHESSMAWRKENLGPFLSLMPEFFPSCFLQDILYLINMGVKITFETKIQDPL